MSRSRKAKRDDATLSLFDVAVPPPALEPEVERAAPSEVVQERLPEAVEDPSPIEAPAPETARSTAELPVRDVALSWLAQGFADRLVRWAREAGAPPESLKALARAGEAVSIATASGHACADLAAIGGDFTLARAALLGSRMVTEPQRGEPRPLVLDADGRLYLRRYFDYERRIARRLMRCRRRVLDAAEERRLAARLSTLFAGNAAALGDQVDWQKLAAALAVMNEVTVISGGPGTGKTTTVVNLLACLLELEPDCRIALAAPTGKAAARMQDAIRQRAALLPEELRARLPTESFTIHRLLGVQPSGDGFRHDAKNPLAIDVLVVDEASMLDLALAAKLFDAVPEGARIILLGDKDQLAAVESGAVFSELSADPSLSESTVTHLAQVCGIAVGRIAPPAPAASTPLRDAAVWFTHNFRFRADSGIGRLASDIKAGRAAAAVESSKASGGSVVSIDDPGYALAAETVQALRAGYSAYLEALGGDGFDRSAVFAAFERFRILCAERDSPRGVRQLNEAIGKVVRQTTEARWPVPPRSPWYCGRPVMVLRNDYVLKLYNGDVGIALPDATGSLVVHFRETDGSYREIATVRLPEHETAFATTVHKAQGSEFDEIALVLPSKPSRVLTRELVYTAVTRARAKVTLIASPDVLRSAIESPTVRNEGLIARMREV